MNNETYAVTRAQIDKLAKDLCETVRGGSDTGTLLCGGALLALNQLGLPCKLDFGGDGDSFRGIEIAGVFYKANVEPPSDS